MKAEIHVTLKRTVLDPQGQTIQRALVSMGHPEIVAVRQGKYFEVELAEDLDPAAARALLDQVAQDILSNPVIEDYRVELKD
ncbi:MAG: phosphoribosylformylglycinamidine synthase subunit PurS [Bryobacteraceae bacterium]|nr:phosphoribosylformylglycinamidine synthase subunit PurS [Bryobacteraceae bacterium]